MSTMNCKFCKNTIVYNDNEDVAVCRHCGSEFETGNEKSIRKSIERMYGKGGSVKYPPVTVARAAGYSAEIYGYATHDNPIDFRAIERAVSAKFPYAKMGLFGEDNVAEKKRSMGLLSDSRVGVMVFPLILPGKMAQIYVVFRGSRGNTEEDTKARKWKWAKLKKNNERVNPQAAGWDGSKNLDWRSNLNFRLATPGWDASTKVHTGFLELYDSVADMVHMNVSNLKTEYPNSSVIVTGHSLGAGLAILCTHHLQKSGIKAFCYPFCPPRAGNLAFARDYYANITGRYASIVGEPGGPYPRCILFTQYTDPVSWEMGVGSLVLRNKRGHGFENAPTATNIKTADSGSFAKQAGYGLFGATQSKVAIFYHVPFVYRATILGMHSFDKMANEFLGWTGRR